MSLDERRLKSLYEELVVRPLESAIKIYPEGRIVQLRPNTPPAGEYPYVDILSGSFKPLHTAHKFVYDNIASGNKTYEVSISRRNKNDYSFAQLLDCVRQFEGYAPVMVTNLPRFAEKAGFLGRQSPTFHIGGDTLRRLLVDHSVHFINALLCNFIVYDRYVDGQTISYNSIFEAVPRYLVPENVHEQLFHVPQELRSISSSEIRKVTLAKTK